MQEKRVLEKMLEALENDETLKAFGNIDEETKALMEKARKKEIDADVMVEMLLEKKNQ